MSTDKAIAKDKPATGLATIKGLLNSDQFKDQVAKALPSHMKPDRFIRIAINATMRTPGLMKCTPESLFECLLSLSQYGLEPDGRRAHLIPYKDKCTLIIDYKGMVELVLRSGLVSSLHADVVRRSDIFEYSMGKIVNHVPWFLRNDPAKPDKAGDIFAAYAICENKDGTAASAVLSKEEIDGVRARSRASGNGPWVTDYAEMSKKTAFRRLTKWLVFSPEIRAAIDREDDDEIVETTVAPYTGSKSDAIADMLRDRMNQEFSDNGQEQEQAETTMFDQCMKFMDDIVMNERNGVKFVSKSNDMLAPVLTYSLPDGAQLVFGDGCEVDGSVDTTREDARSAIETLVSKAIQKAERKA